MRFSMQNHTPFLASFRLGACGKSRWRIIDDCYNVGVLLGGVQTATGASLSWLGVLLFGCTTLFTLVTLPVEFDASNRAIACLQRGGYVTEKELMVPERSLMLRQ